MSFNSENPKPIKQRQYGLKLSSAHKATTKERHCTPIDAEMHPKIADRTFLFFQPDFHNHVSHLRSISFPETMRPFPAFKCSLKLDDTCFFCSMCLNSDIQPFSDDF